MIRLSMLQLRVQAITAAVALIAFAVLLAATGPHLASLYAASGLRGCQPASCGQRASSFLQQVNSTSPYATVDLFSIIIIALTPAITGLFWGAPLLARELETGTFALAWSQSVTRARWLAVKLTVGCVAAIAVTEALSLLFAWWAAPLGQAAGLGGSGSGLAMNRFNPLAFVTHGITPLGYAAFAFTLGVTAGALIRRTIPAMAVTLAIFAALQVAMPLWVRPNLAPPDRTVIPVTSLGAAIPSETGAGGTIFTLFAITIPGQPGAWLLSSGPVNAAGQATSTAPAACTSVEGTSPSPGTNQGASPEGATTGPVAFRGCLASHGIREAITYQPASRYWRFQATETAIYLALALALAGYCFRRLSRLS
jgi:ABC-type transport system involved in multi-copper enzyme maturation permease subunit